MRLTPVPFPGFSSHGRLLEAGGNVTAAGSCGSSEEYNLVWIAIAIHVAGSVGINVGQNLQAMGLVALDEADRQKCSSLIRSKLWLIGCALFISCSIVNFLALGLGPASILVPLEAVQFVVNVAFGKFVRKVEVPMRMIGGVVCMVAGVALAVIFGESGSFCFTEDRLIELWTFTHGWGWWIYIAVTFGISIVCLVGHRRLWARRQAGLPVKNAAVVMPVLYAIPSALLGGAQMIVQSKCLAELTELMARGSSMTITNWFFWVEAVLVCSFGLFWFFRLTQSLGMYEPLFIIPLMQVCVCVCACVCARARARVRMCACANLRPQLASCFSPPPLPTPSLSVACLFRPTSSCGAASPAASSSMSSLTSTRALRKQRAGSSTFLASASSSSVSTS